MSNLHLIWIKYIQYIFSDSYNIPFPLLSLRWWKLSGSAWFNSTCQYKNRNTGRLFPSNSECGGTSIIVWGPLMCSTIPQLQVNIIHLSVCSHLSQLMLQGDWWHCVRPRKQWWNSEANLLMPGYSESELRMSSLHISREWNLCLCALTLCKKKCQNNSFPTTVYSGLGWWSE